MAFLRTFLAVAMSFCLIAYFPCGAGGATPPVGILTQAVEARVDEAQAFAGLSIFDGEQLSTARQGRLGVRAGRSILTLGGGTSATVFRITEGVHIDLEVGTLYVNSAAGEAAEVHVGEALLQTASRQAAQAGVVILAPKVLQVTAQKGGLNFSYHEEFRFLPEGQTYRIYLDAPAAPQIDAVDTPTKAGIAGKVAYFIVGTGAGGGLVFAIHQGSAGGNLPISPAKP